LSSMKIDPDPDIALVTRLLNDNGLPTEDLRGNHGVRFFACSSPTGLHAVVGIQTCEDVALLRSLAVDPATRDRGMATALVKHAEAYAVQRGVNRLYLLTDTAETFFFRLGYRPLARIAAPQAVRNTSEFSSLCPDNAAFMHKSLSHDPEPS